MLTEKICVLGNWYIFLLAVRAMARTLPDTPIWLEVGVFLPPTVCTATAGFPLIAGPGFRVTGSAMLEHVELLRHHSEERPIIAQRVCPRFVTVCSRCFEIYLSYPIGRRGR